MSVLATQILVPTAEMAVGKQEISDHVSAHVDSCMID
jgi:hypothetical protein